MGLLIRMNIMVRSCQDLFQGCSKILPSSCQDLTMISTEGRPGLLYIEMEQGTVWKKRI